MYRITSTTGRVAIAAAVASAIVSSAYAADRPWNTDASGNWSTAGNWTGGLPGTSDRAILPNVTTGSRTVTVNAAASANQLLMEQSTTTPGVANRLLVDGATLSLGSSGTPATQALASGATASITVLNAGNIDLTGSSSGATKQFNNYGTLTLGQGGVTPSNGFIRNTNGGNTLALTNYGTMSWENSSGMIRSSTGAYLELNNEGLFNVNGSNYFGSNGSIRANGTRTTFNNRAAGTVSIAPTATLNFESIASSGSSPFVFTNAGTFDVGSSTLATSAASLNKIAGGNGYISLANTGAFSIYGKGSYTSDISAPGALTSSTKAFWIDNNAGGTINLRGGEAANGSILVGITRGDSSAVWAPTLVNANGATVNVSAMTGVSAAKIEFGQLSTESNSRRGDAIIDSSGAFNIGSSATFVLRARSRGSFVGTPIFTNQSGGVFTLGSSASASTGGVFNFDITDGGTGGQGTTGQGSTLSNSGVVTLYGTSQIASVARTPTLITDNSIDFERMTVTNSGTINLHDSSTIGSTLKNTVLTNSGTINKIGTGTATIDSGNITWIRSGDTVVQSTPRSFTSSGTINVQAGTLSTPMVLDLTGGNIKGGGTLSVAGLTRSSTSVAVTYAPGNSIGTLGIDVNTLDGSVIFAANDVFDFEIITSASDQIAFSGLNAASDVTFNGNVINFTGPASNGTYTLFTFASTDGFVGTPYTGVLSLGTLPTGAESAELIYNADSIQLQVAVPEPVSLSMLGLGAMAFLRRRRVA